jgi:hypothetical protein
LIDIQASARQLKNEETIGPTLNQIAEKPLSAQSITEKRRFISAKLVPKLLKFVGQEANDVRLRIAVRFPLKAIRGLL